MTKGDFTRRTPRCGLGFLGTTNGALHYSAVFPAGTTAKCRAAVLLLSAADAVKCNYMFDSAWEGCSL